MTNIFKIYFILQNYKSILKYCILKPFFIFFDKKTFMFLKRSHKSNQWADCRPWHPLSMANGFVFTTEA